MFDFGNKKLIEMLENEIDRLNREKKEYIKTVEYLIKQIDELKEIIKEKEEEIDFLERKIVKNDKDYNFTIKTYKEIVQSKKDEINSIMNKYFFKENAKTLIISKYENSIFGGVCIEVAPIEYVEIKEEIKKITSTYNNKKYVYFKKDNSKLFNNSYIYNMLEKGEVPTYNGIPFRSLQDLYKIIDFLTNEQYIYFKKERYFIEINCENNDIVFYNNNNSVDIYILHGNDKYFINDDFIKDFENSKNNSDLDGIKTCPIKIILTYNKKCFRTKKELMKIIKKECYHDKKILNKIINTLNN